MIILIGLTAEQIKEVTAEQIKKVKSRQIKEITAKATVKENYFNQITHDGKIAGARIILLPKTQNQQELAQYYTAADYFLNLTYEDNYPTVNLEAEACGTDVITYDVGGCRETISRLGSKCVKAGDIGGVVERITF